MKKKMAACLMCRYMVCPLNDMDYSSSDINLTMLPCTKDYQSNSYSRIQYEENYENDEPIE